MDVLLPIRPKYVVLIFSGIKKYEFRKIIPKDDFSRIYIYATNPAKQIVGFFEPGEIINKDINSLWKACEKYSGLSYHEFIKYFDGHQSGYAIPINSFHKWSRPVDPRSVIRNFHAPQSFQYIDRNIFKIVR